MAGRHPKICHKYRAVRRKGEMEREHDQIVLSVVLAVETYDNTWEDATCFFSMLYPEVDVVFVGQTDHVATFKCHAACYDLDCISARLS